MRVFILFYVPITINKVFLVSIDFSGVSGHIFLDNLFRDNLGLRILLKFVSNLGSRGHVSSYEIRTVLQHFVGKGEKRLILFHPMLTFTRVDHFVSPPAFYFLFDSYLVKLFEQSLLFLSRIIIIVLELDIFLSLLDPL